MAENAPKMRASVSGDLHVSNSAPGHERFEDLQRRLHLQRHVGKAHDARGVRREAVAAAGGPLGALLKAPLAPALCRKAPSHEECKPRQALHTVHPAALSRDALEACTEMDAHR